MLSNLHEARLQRARIALEGLSVGDGFGDRFFIPTKTAQALILARASPKAPWRYTDDTNTALSVFQILRQHGEIRQDALALSFGQAYDHHRKYGSAMHDLLPRYRDGEPCTLAANLFEGQGSYGNGAAMRVAPLGAYFADDLVAVVEQARLSAEVTHTHPEGIAGAIAIAVAAAYACKLGHANERPTRLEFIDLVLPHIPDSEVRSGVRRARDVQSTAVNHAVGMIGNGSRISAQDTAPFTLWAAGEQLDSFEEALWLTAEGLGDVDTNCAIVGGIVAGYVGQAGIPDDWNAHREPLPDWAFCDTGDSPEIHGTA